MKPTLIASYESTKASLTYRQIAELLFGAEQIFITDEGISGSKYNPETLNHWKTLSDILYERALTTTGLRLDFETNSPYLILDVTGKFEILRDGKLFASTRAEKRIRTKEEAEDASNTVLRSKIKVDLDGQPHRITVAFPSHQTGVIHSMTVDADAVILPHNYREKFVFYGDSITQGWNSKVDISSYAWRTGVYFDADFRIYGVGGAYFDGGIFEIPADFDPDRVFIAYGTNDFSHFKTLEDLRNAMSAFVDKAVAAYGAEKILGILPPWRYDKWEAAMGNFDQCRALILEEYEKRGIAVFDALQATPHGSGFFADPLHPNAAGFACYARALIEAMEERMKS